MDQDIFFHLDMPGAFAATYTAATGVAVDTIVMLRIGVEVFGFESQVSGTRNTIKYRIDHCGAFETDSIFVIDGTVYTVSERIEQNESTITVGVK